MQGNSVCSTHSSHQSTWKRGQARGAGPEAHSHSPMSAVFELFCRHQGFYLQNCLLPAETPIPGTQLWSKAVGRDHGIPSSPKRITFPWSHIWEMEGLKVHSTGAKCSVLPLGYMMLTLCVGSNALINCKCQNMSWLLTESQEQHCPSLEAQGSQQADKRMSLKELPVKGTRRAINTEKDTGADLRWWRVL